jgi:hypothetical protein
MSFGFVITPFCPREPYEDLRTFLPSSVLLDTNLNLVIELLNPVSFTGLPACAVFVPIFQLTGICQAEQRNSLKKIFWIGSRILILVGSDMLAQGPTPLVIAVHQELRMTESQVDQILGGANALLSCDHHFSHLRRTQPLALLPANINGRPFDGVVTSWQMMLTIMAQPGNVKLVKEIDICVNARGEPIPGTFAGCTPRITPREQPDFAVAFTDSTEAGMALAHEYSHSQGLIHRDDAGALMNPALGGDNKSLSEDECKSLYP